MAESLLRIGMVGCGLIARLHAAAMHPIKSVRIDAILARSDAESFAEQIRRDHLGNPEMIQTVDELCERVDCVAIYVANDAQLEIVRQVAAAKQRGARVRALIIDKPLGRNLHEAEEICRLVEEAGLLSAYFENQIHMKSVAREREKLRATMAAQGSPLIVRAAEEHSGPHKPWFWDPRRSGGGVLLDMGCHSIAVAWYLLTPLGKPLDFLQPIGVQCTTALLKWGHSPWREDLLQRMGVDYSKTPAEDYASGTIEFLNPETKQIVLAQFTNSWMYDKPGLRLSIECLGAGYGFDINVSPDESDPYGYTEENRDAVESFLAGRDALLNVQYGKRITELVMACYLSADKKQRISLVD